MPFAPPEPTTAPRSLPPTLPARDKRPSATGFSSLVDDKAAVKADPRTRADASPREAQPKADRAPREAAEPAIPAPARAAETQDPDQPKAAVAASDQLPANETPAKPKTETAEVAPAETKAADVSPVTLPDPSMIVPDAPAAALTPTIPVAAPVVVPQQPQAQVTAQAAAPLSIAAAGLAAAKAVSAKPDQPATTTATTAPPTPAAADAEPAIVPTADGKTPKTAEMPVKTGFAAPDVASGTASKTETPQQPDVAPATQIKPNAVPADGKAAQPAPAETDKLAAAVPQPADRPAEPGPVRNGDSTGLIPSLTGPAPAHHTAPAAPTPAVQLTAAVATAQPVPLNGLAVELAARATTGATRFEIRLDPAELGRIDVRIDIDKSGQVTSHLTVEKPETLAMLRQDSPQLQRALNDAGFKTADGAMQFSLGDQSQSQAQQQNADGGQRHAHRLFIQDDDIAAPAVPLRDYGRLAAARSGVDISV